MVPRLFELLASFRRRELFTLGVVALTLGTAAVGSLFGISLALGAFLAGTLIADSDLSHQVMGEAIPFRDVFAGLFFVSIGMLVDPGLIVANLPVLLVLLVLIGPVKGALVTALGAAFRYPLRTIGAGRHPARAISGVLVRDRPDRDRGRDPVRGALRAPALERGPHDHPGARCLPVRPAPRGAGRTRLGGSTTDEAPPWRRPGIAGSR